MRVTNNMVRNTLLADIYRNTNGLLRTENQLASGKVINQVSDDPRIARASLGFDSRLAQVAQWQRNLGTAQSYLQMADSALGEITSRLNSANALAVSMVNDTATADQRKAAAIEVRNMVQELVAIGNQRYGDRYVFAGTGTDQSPFSLRGDGYVSYTGNDQSISVNIDAANRIAMNVDGQEAFGSLSTVLGGGAGLSPDINLGESTSLATLGVPAGSIVVDYGTAVTVDLTSALTLSDVKNRIEGATAGQVRVDLNATRDGLVLSADSALTVSESGAGTTAAALGIAYSAPSGVLAGDALASDLRLNPTATRLSSLREGAGVFKGSIELIYDGERVTVDLSAADSLADVKKMIETATSGEITVTLNASRKGIELTYASGGLTINDVGGGRTASELGILGAAPSGVLGDTSDLAGVITDETLLSDLAGGIIGPQADFTIDQTTSAGTTSTVVSAVGTVGDLRRAIDALGIGVSLRVTESGDSLTLISRTSGEQLSVSGPDAAALGWDGTPAESTSIFSALADLASAFETNDSTAIRTATDKVHAMLDRVLSARATVGARMARVESATARLSDQMVNVQELQSQTVDLDFAEAALRYQNQQTALEAALKVSASVLQLSLVNFLQ